MNKHLFIKTIDSIELQLQHDINIAENYDKIFPNAYCANLLYDNSILINSILDLLKKLMNDDNEHSWIDYFCYDLDFGKKNNELKAYINGKEINLTTSSNLYEFLIKNDSKNRRNNI